MAIKIKYSEEERNLIYNAMRDMMLEREDNHLNQSEKVLHSILIEVGDKFAPKLDNEKKTHSIKLKYHQAWALTQFCSISIQKYDAFSDILLQSIIFRLGAKL